MNGHVKGHAKHMLVGGVGVAVLMVVVGVGWQQAVTWGLLLACPVGMLAMMWFMTRRRGGVREGAHGAPQQRVSVPTPAEPRPGA